MSSVANRIEVLHGVNLGALGRRPATHYGDLDLPGLEQKIKRYAAELDIEVGFFQTDHEGEYVQRLHEIGESADGLILNPGAWTHYAWSIRDALEIAALPAVEVHLSKVDQREEFRRQSVIRDLVVATVSGLGPEGYQEALVRLKQELA